MQEVWTEVSPLVYQTLVLVLSVVLTVIAREAKKYLVAHTTEAQRKMIIDAANVAVLFTRQVGVARGADGGAELKALATSVLLQNLQAVGINIDANDADVYIEAAYNALKGGDPGEL